jgi:hypothetical protein
MTRQIKLPGYRIGKAGKLERDVRRLSVSQRLKQQTSKRVRVAKEPTPR